MEQAAALAAACALPNRAQVLCPRVILALKNSKASTFLGHLSPNFDTTAVS